MIKYFFLFCLASSLFMLECMGQQSNCPAIKAQKGIVKMNICSRGCYQYYLHTPEGDYFPDSLQQEFKQENLNVIFTGTILSDSTLLLYPSEGDAPLPLRKIPNIQLTAIQKEE